MIKQSRQDLLVVRDLDKQITRAEKPAYELLDQLGTLDVQVEKELFTAWKDYYLVPDRTLLNADLEETGRRLLAWWQDFPVYFKYFLLGKLKWNRFLAYASVFTVLCFLLLFSGGLWVRYHLPQFDLPNQMVNYLCISFAISLWISRPLLHIDFEPVAFYTLSQILIGWGLIHVFWSVRTALRDDPALSPNPLRCLWVVFAVSLVLQNLALPAVPQELAWMAALLMGSFKLKRLLPLITERLERFLATLSIVLLLAFLLLALFGWINISLLLANFWFIICLGLQFGAMASTILNRRVSRFPDTNVGYLLQGIVQGLGLPALWLLDALLILGWLGINLGDFDILKQVSDLELGWGKLSVNFVRLVLVFVAFYLARSGLIVLKSLLTSVAYSRGDLDARTVASLRTLLTYLVWAVYIVIALALLGLDLTSLTVVAGGLSVGIGFGLQSIVNNFISGLILLFGRSIQPGDIIQDGNMWAEVKEVNIRSTEVETFDRASILIPNSQLIGERIVNWTHRDNTLRRKIGVGVAYGSDIDLARRLLLQAALAHPHVLQSPEPFVRFSDFGSSSLDFTLYIFTSIEYGWMAESEIRFEIDRIFRENGIEIAFPQRDLHIRSIRGKR